ncbi:MAG: UDP-phosphate N-acetylglucosaminyl 1-phosphate transferase, partial [Deltaproteobacteria bacterium]|nr:UDP-phosphate N-acetylglucosaminyl 1-phosphate transferase [Deltaproteobacteria bacterium]
VSPLPRQADIARAEQVLRNARDEAARRYLGSAPGPWGADAAVPPAARYDDP